MLATSSGVVTSLSLWIIFLLSSGVCARKQQDDTDDEESWSESVSRARCASRCLSLHSVAALSTPLQVRTPMARECPGLESELLLK